MIVGQFHQSSPMLFSLPAAQFSTSPQAWRWAIYILDQAWERRAVPADSGNPKGKTTGIFEPMWAKQGHKPSPKSP